MADTKLLYRRPFNSAPRISATKQQHERRVPPSVEPGIDYYLPYGTPLYVPADGYVRWAYNTAGPAGPWVVGFEHTDGHWTRLLHMSKINVGMLPGTLKRGGDLAGLSGQSYLNGIPQPHVHVTMWYSPGVRPVPGVTYPNDNFEWHIVQQEAAFASGGDVKPFEPVPPPPTEDTTMNVYRIANPAGGLNGVGFAAGPSGAFYSTRNGAETDKLATWFNRTGVPFVVTEDEANLVLDANGIPRTYNGKPVLTIFGWNYSWAKAAAGQA